MCQTQNPCSLSKPNQIRTVTTLQFCLQNIGKTKYQDTLLCIQSTEMNCVELYFNLDCNYAKCIASQWNIHKQNDTPTWRSALFVRKRCIYISGVNTGNCREVCSELLWEWGWFTRWSRIGLLVALRCRVALREWHMLHKLIVGINPD